MYHIAILFILSLIYAVVRYVAFVPENINHLPVFVVNKAVSVAAALSFVAGFLQQWRKQHGYATTIEPATWFRTGTYAACMHIAMSLAILRPAYFKEFFAGERLSFGGEMVFLFGAMTLGGVYLLHRTGWSLMHRWLLSLGTMGVLFGHVLAMGVCRGLNINKSHAYLPPMWLLSLIGIGAGIWWVLWSRPVTSNESDLPGTGAR